MAAAPARVAAPVAVASSPRLGPAAEAAARTAVPMVATVAVAETAVLVAAVGEEEEAVMAATAVATVAVDGTR